MILLKSNKDNKDKKKMSDNMWENAVKTMRKGILENEDIYNFLMDFEPKDNEGYCWTRDPEYKKISDKLDRLTGGIHSASSFAICLRCVVNDLKKENHKDDDIPDGFLCPISHKIMEFPVTTSVGNTYEKEYIEKWFEKHDTDPMFNQTLDDKNLIENKNLCETIREWEKNN